MSLKLIQTVIWERYGLSPWCTMWPHLNNHSHLQWMLQTGISEHAFGQTLLTGICGVVFIWKMIYYAWPHQFWHQNGVGRVRFWRLFDDLKKEKPLSGSRKYLYRQTPAVEVGSDVFLSQGLQQILGKTPEQTAGLGRWRTDTHISVKEIVMFRKLD